MPSTKIAPPRRNKVVTLAKIQISLNYISSSTAGPNSIKVHRNAPITPPTKYTNRSTLSNKMATGAKTETIFADISPLRDASYYQREYVVRSLTNLALWEIRGIYNENISYDLWWTWLFERHKLFTTRIRRTIFNGPGSLKDTSYLQREYVVWCLTNLSLWKIRGIYNENMSHDLWWTWLWEIQAIYNENMSYDISWTWLFERHELFTTRICLTIFDGLCSLRDTSNSQRECVARSLMNLALEEIRAIYNENMLYDLW